MSFTSFRFVIFFGIIYFSNWICVAIAKTCKNKIVGIYKILLLVESYAFVIIADWKTSVSLLLLTMVCYVFSIGICKFRNRATACKTIFICGLLITIGQLCMFKYYDFFAGTIFRLFNRSYMSSGGYIPLGISFFTFSATGYLIDVYRGKYEAYGNLVDLATYLAFFPKLLSGPLVRSDIFIKQLQKGISCINLNNLQKGIQYVVWGLLKKMVVADHLAIFVDNVFANPSAFDSATCIWAMVSYSLQIYFDFAGYSDMAIGFSKMLGIDVHKNFDLPYISKNVTEFWKRWHISLSSWLQDYVYISFGGNRKGKMRTKINLILTMLIGGLWHGANWTFVIWGAIHGIALVVQKKFKTISEGKETIKIWSGFSVIFTFIFVTITWVFFRASSLSNAFEIIRQALTVKEGITQIYSWTWFAIVLAICEVVFSVHCCNKANCYRVCVKYPILKLDTIKNLVLFFVLIGLTIILAYVGDTAFIYGQF